MDFEDAVKIVSEDRRARIETCKEEILNVLKKYNCALRAKLETNIGSFDVPIEVISLL